MLESIARIEARIRQICQMIGEPDPLSLENPGFTAGIPRSNKDFGAELRRAGIAASGDQMPPRPALALETAGVAPVTISLDAAETIPLEPDAARRRERYLPFIREAAAQTDLPEALITAVIQAESDFRPATVSPAGAMGLMQLMPANVRELKVGDPFDPRQNILAGARHLRDQMNRFGTLEKALAAYNAGPGAVERYGGIPPYRETQDYVRKITGALRQAGALP